MQTRLNGAPRVRPRVAVLAAVAVIVAAMPAVGLAQSRVGVTVNAGTQATSTAFTTPYGAKKRPRLGRCWSSLPSSLRLCRLRCSSSSSRSLAG